MVSLYCTQQLYAAISGSRPRDLTGHAVDIRAIRAHVLLKIQLNVSPSYHKLMRESCALHPDDTRDNQHMGAFFINSARVDYNHEE